MNEVRTAQYFPAGKDRAAGKNGLKRDIGFMSLMFISLGSIIGSGWLLGALTAAQVAGGASIPTGRGPTSCPPPA